MGNLNISYRIGGLSRCDFHISPLRNPFPYDPSPHTPSLNREEPHGPQNLSSDVSYCYLLSVPRNLAVTKGEFSPGDGMNVCQPFFAARPQPSRLPFSEKYACGGWRGEKASR